MRVMEAELNFLGAFEEILQFILSRTESETPFAFVCAQNSTILPLNRLLTLICGFFQVFARNYPGKYNLNCYFGLHFVHNLSDF